ncbi:pyrroloquinoline quinone biosynthesis peptide chaperone PqqD [Actibacterium sp. 188UL27-1]|uniref:pyrroloquinoline quinone biosynthesis peptide chaperone PqqD n=1 Tax=Actibacterium sp. 188UL27-1 TaxID=2786961 RepID=UPI00195A1C77|nr:pyrroloquinoline quinone biosynthesis peptide chaperone PqqD [Actibacterium sp. 188UL27-1]MBM7066199.1 pyrroloquinoline quinone biosynthesis peptide chaperone PqqD [Actibacterium sp. 188UL27-1]
MTLPAASIPVIPRGVRLHHDKVRNQWVLLAPERTISLDPIGHAILLEIDGTRTFETIARTLADKYDAPLDQITSDVGEYLHGLMIRRIMDVAT